MDFSFPIGKPHKSFQFFFFSVGFPNHKKMYRILTSQIWLVRTNISQSICGYGGDPTLLIYFEQNKVEINVTNIYEYNIYGFPGTPNYIYHLIIVIS